MQDLEKRLEQVLSSVPEDAVQKPYTDPQGAAVTALLVADWLDSTGTDATLASDLAALARSMLSIVESLGGEYLPDGVGIPGDLVHRGQAVRGQAIAELEKHLKDAEAKAWIDAVRLGIGVVDLVYDLRTLGALHARRADALPPEAAKVPTSVRAAADAIEYALRAGEREDHSAARTKIARIWTVLAPLYEKASAAGRAHTRGAGKERAFPALPLVASHRRAQRRPLSVVASVGSAPPPPSAQSPVIVNVPGAGKAPSEPRLEAAPITVMKSEPPAAGETLVEQTMGRAQTWSESRLAIRHLLEIEVAIECEGTKRVGFTENMSTGGVFVATYLSAAQGSKVVVQLTARGSKGDETVKLAGEARWQRPSSSERWPGVGVKFDDSGPEHEARMNKLLSLRDRVL
jgi:Tfp pilus assembly protein PilZ